MNHLMASPPWFWPRSIGICTHQSPAFGFSSIITTRPRCWSHFFMSPDSKLSANNTSESFAIPKSPAYFAARPEEMGGTGDPPVTAGDPPTGIAETDATEPVSGLVEARLTAPSDELPVLPAFDFLDRP